MDLFDLSIREKRQQKDLAKQEKLKNKDQDQTSPHNKDNKPLTET